MNIQEQLKAYRDQRAVKAEVIKSLVEKSMADGQTLDKEQQEVYDNTKAEIEAIDKHLAFLADSESLMVSKAVVVPNTQARGDATTLPPISKQSSESRGGVTVPLQKKLDAGIQFARHAMCILAAKGNVTEAARLAQEHYGSESPVANVLKWSHGRGMEGILQKATVNAATTTDAAWAGPLLAYNNYVGDFIDYLRPRTIIGQFGLNGVPALRRIPFNVHIKGQTVGGAGYWVGQGKAKPVTAFGYDDTYHGWFKVAGIAVLTDDIIRFSDPAAENLVRDSLADVLAARMDTDFIDPAFAGVANVSPQSITNGATHFATLGKTADNARDDLARLWAGALGADMDVSQAVYIMPPITALYLSLMRNALGQPEFPTISIKGGTFLGVPVIISNYLNHDSNGATVVLAFADEIYYSDDGQATIDFSTEASIQMLDNPTVASDTGTPTTLVSMFQTDSTALRAHRFVNWSRRRPQAVSYLTNVEWGQP
jgi:HK97 family phage major capsid protein